MITKKEAEDYINSIPKFAPKTGPENTEHLMRLLGNPELSAKTVHVAGTNGKGSVSKMMSLMLSEAGFRTGLFISPHLIRINERISIDGLEISDEDFAECFETVRVAVDKLMEEGGSHPAYFEWIFAMAAVYFKKKDAEYVVYETGLGGRLDATNCISPVMTAITQIGLDHMQYLGNTIEEIAAEKAGIIKKGVPLCYYTGRIAANKIIELRAREKGCPAFNACWTDVKIQDITAERISFSLDTRYFTYENLVLNTGAVYQTRNAAEAVYMFDRLFHDRSTDKKGEIIRAALLKFNMQGRMQYVSDNIIVDGAHNEAAVDVLTDSLREMYGNLRRRSFRLLFAISADKEYDTVISKLCESLRPEKVYITEIASARRLEADKAEEVFRDKLGENVVIEVIENVEECFERASEELPPESILLAAGSLYLAGEILRDRK